MRSRDVTSSVLPLSSNRLLPSVARVARWSSLSSARHDSRGDEEHHARPGRQPSPGTHAPGWSSQAARPSSRRYASVRGSFEELPALTALEAAEDQFAAREAWLKWIDRDY